jgi:hypothetical protein
MRTRYWLAALAGGGALAASAALFFPLLEYPIRKISDQVCFMSPDPHCLMARAVSEVRGTSELTTIATQGASRLLLSGDVDGAINLLQIIKDDLSSWGRVSASVAPKLAEKGGSSSIIRLVGQIPTSDSNYTQDARAAAVRRFIELGDFKSAELFLPPATKGPMLNLDRFDPIGDAIKALLAVGEVDRALEVAQRFGALSEDTSGRRDPFGVSQTFSAECGQSFPRFVSDLGASRRLKTRLSLAVALTQQGRLEEAERLFPETVGDWNRFVVYAAFAHQTANQLSSDALLEMLEKAEALARSLKRDDYRLFALSTIAVQFAQAGHQQRALAIMEEAQGDFWTKFGPAFWEENLPAIASDLAAAGALGDNAKNMGNAVVLENHPLREEILAWQRVADQAKKKT